MQLKPIEKDDWQAATKILNRGFQECPPKIWSNFLKRIRTIETTGITQRIGYLLQNDGDDVGIMLTLRSRRNEEDGGTREVVNLAGWYVDEQYRWYAPRMFSDLIKDKDVVFTDLTSSRAVRKILTALNFKQWNQGLLVSSLPQALMGWSKGVKVLPLEELPQDALSEADRKLLEDHARLGCIACALKHGETYEPLIFRRQTYWNIPVARIIYASSRDVILNNLTNILYFLLKLKILFIAVECNKPRLPSQFFFKDRSIKYYKGHIDSDMIDYAYSELVLLDL